MANQIIAPKLYEYHLKAAEWIYWIRINCLVYSLVLRNQAPGQNSGCYLSGTTIGNCNYLAVLMGSWGKLHFLRQTGDMVSALQISGGSGSQGLRPSWYSHTHTHTCSPSPGASTQRPPYQKPQLRPFPGALHKTSWLGALSEAFFPT